MLIESYISVTQSAATRRTPQSAKQTARK